MKKSIALFLSLAMAGGILSSAFAFGAEHTDRAAAANIKSLEMTDNFDGEALDSDAWTATNGVGQKVEYSALRMNGINTWGSYIALQKMPLDETWDSFTIDMQMNWVGTPSWSGIFFGSASVNDFYYTSPSAYFLQINSGGVASAGESGRGMRLAKRDMSSSTGFFSTPDKTEYVESDVFNAGNLLAGGSVQRVIMEFTKKPAPNEDNEYSMKFKWGDADAEESTYTVHDFKTIEIGGYMGFTTYGETVMEIRSFELSEGTGENKTSLFKDDFSTGDISYPSFPTPDTAWRGVQTNTEERTYCGKFCTVSYDGVKNGSLVYADPIERNAMSTKSFEISYDLTTSALTENTYVGSGFALETPDSDASKKSFIGMRKAGEAYKLAYISDGKVVGNEVTVEELTGLTATVKLVGYYDNTVRVYINDIERAAFEDVEFDGYTSVSAVTPDSTAQAPENGSAIDNFSLYIFEAIYPDSENVGINFQGSKEYEIAGEIIEEHYVNTRKWIMYGGVKTPIQMNRNYIQFHDISGDAAFLSKSRFGDQIARFDFRPSSLPEGTELAGFGYSFGREMLDTSCNDAPGVYFRKDGNTTSIVGKNMTTASGTTSATCSLNVFKDTETWYTCMLIISSRTVKVFIKETSQPDSAFGKPQIVFTDVDTFGYTALMIENTGKAYYNATNFSITNIDPMIQEA